MTYDNNNNNNNKRHDNDNDRYGGERGNPKSSGQMRYKHKDRGNTFDSNGLYSREMGLYDRTAYYRDPSYSVSRDSWNNGRFTSDSDRASYDGRRDSYSGDRHNKNRDHSSSDSKRYYGSDYHRYDRRERHVNNRNRHDNPSRSPTRDRDTGRCGGSRESGLGRDTERSEAADRDTASPPRRNIRTDFVIYQGGLLYSDHKAHDLPSHHHSPVSGHHAATYIKRKGTSPRSRWGVPPVSTSHTALCPIRSDGPTSSLQSPLPSLSPTTDMSGPSSSTPETRFLQSSTSQSPPPQSTTMISSATRFSTATSVTTATTQDRVTNHIQKLQMTTYPAVVQDHRQIQEVQPQAPPQDRRSELVSAAAVAYKALQGALNDYEQQTGNSTGGISVATLLGKRSVGRPSKVRLENEETALLGIKRAKSEMRELEQVPKQLNGVVGQARISSTPRRTDIDKADTLGHTAHLSITSAVTMNTVCHRQNTMQGHHQQKLQPLRAWETVQEQESQRQDLQRISKPAIQTPPQHLSWQSMAPPANTFPRRVTDRTSQVLHLHGEAKTDKGKETRSDEREGYLGSLFLKWKHHKKGDTPDGQISPKECKPPQTEACLTPSPVALKQGVQFINTQRESSHAEEIVQVQHTDGSETNMCSSTNKTTSATFSGSVQSKGSPAKNGLAQDRYNNVFLRRKVTGKERSYTSQKRKLVTRRDQQPPPDDSAASIDHRPSTAKCNSFIPPSKPRRRVTFADLKVDDESGIRESQDDVINLSKSSNPTIPLPAHVYDILEPPRSISPSPPLLDLLTLSPPPSAQEETDDMLISPASSPVLSSCPVPPTKASPLRDHSSSNVSVDLAMNSRTTIGTSDSPAEIEEARRRVLALMEQLDATAIAEPTITTEPTPDSDEKKSADAIATELSTEMETDNSDKQAPHGTAATQKSSQTPAPDAKNSPTASISHRQADDEVPRNQAIERTEATPATNSTPAPYSQADSFTPVSSLTPTPHYANTARPTYGYWCQCAMEGRPCVCGYGTYNSEPAPPGYYHSYTQHTTHTTHTTHIRTDYFYADGHHYPAWQDTFSSSHQNAWGYYLPPWTGDQYGDQPWALPPPPPSTFFGHAPPSPGATQPPLRAGSPTSASSQPA